MIGYLRIGRFYSNQGSFYRAIPWRWRSLVFRCGFSERIAAAPVPEYDQLGMLGSFNALRFAILKYVQYDGSR